jgi:chromate reductase
MKKIISLGGSNSKKSINKELAQYTANKIVNSETIVADLNEFELPLYSTDLENEKGIPDNAIKLNDLIEDADGIVISMAEHNGSYTAAFKNAIDWLSRINQKVWKDKPMFLMATSPGVRGGATVLNTANMAFPFFGYRAYSTQRTSRSSVTLISPGYVISSSIFLAMSLAIFVEAPSSTLSALTITRTSLPAWMA